MNIIGKVLRIDKKQVLCEYNTLFLGEIIDKELLYLSKDNFYWDIKIDENFWVNKRFYPRKMKSKKRVLVKN